MRYSEINQQPKQIASKVFNQIKNTLHQRFDSGKATCTIASKHLASAFQNASIPFKVVSGDFNDAGHWWIESNGVIYDLGNNITDQAIESGITPIVTSADNPNYKAEDYLSYDEFVNYYPSIKNF